MLSSVRPDAPRRAHAEPLALDAIDSTSLPAHLLQGLERRSSTPGGSSRRGGGAAQAAKVRRRPRAREVCRDDLAVDGVVGVGISAAFGVFGGVTGAASEGGVRSIMWTVRSKTHIAVPFVVALLESTVTEYSLFSTVHVRRRCSGALDVVIFSVTHSSPSVRRRTSRASAVAANATSIKRSVPNSCMTGIDAQREVNSNGWRATGPQSGVETKISIARRFLRRGYARSLSLHSRALHSWRRFSPRVRRCE